MYSAFDYNINIELNICIYIGQVCSWNFVLKDLAKNCVHYLDAVTYNTVLESAHDYVLSKSNVDLVTSLTVLDFFIWENENWTSRVLSKKRVLGIVICYR